MPEAKELFPLLDHAMSHARECAQGLTDPEEDILPVLMWTGPYGMGIMPLLDMKDEKTKDRLAEMMTTVLAVGRAEQAVMITTSWMVKAEAPVNTEGPIPHGYDVIGCPPSEHPDRVEAVTAMYACADQEKDSMSSAVLIRHPDRKPDLGEWDTNMSDCKIGGRFGDAIHWGFEFVKEMPQPLIDILDEGWELGEQQQLISRFHKVFTGFVNSMLDLKAAAGPIAPEIKVVTLETEK